MGVSRRDLSFDIFRDRRCLGSNLNLRARVARLAHAHDVRFVGGIPMGIPYRTARARAVIFDLRLFKTLPSLIEIKVNQLRQDDT